MQVNKGIEPRWRYLSDNVKANLMELTKSILQTRYPELFISEEADTSKRKRSPEFDIQEIISHQDGFGKSRLLVCPVCGGEYNHVIGFEIVSSDYYEAWSPGCGSCYIVKMSGECGHDWEICIGFHKGYCYMFADRKIQDANSGLQASMLA